MKQVVQEIRSGDTKIRDIPAPVIKTQHLLVQTHASLISKGTESYVVDLAKKSLLGKARARPDHVKRVLTKIKQEGLRATVSQVQAKLDEPMPLGYSAAGRVLVKGAGVEGFEPGTRVAVAAPHAGIVCVGQRVCARIPGNLSYEEASFASVGAIALEGIRLAKVGIGDRVLVIGLGLIGQITCALLRAQGCKVFGVDLDQSKADLALTMGASEVGIGTPHEQVKQFSDGHGMDAVLVTAATPSSAPVTFAAESSRVRGKVVVVGATGLELVRQPFFEKEISLTVSSSLGAGRGDESYEDRGVDYPIGYARWTVQRNMLAFLEATERGDVNVKALISHTFPIDEAEKAYELIQEPDTSAIGVVLSYPDVVDPLRRVDLRSKAMPGRGVSVIGAGNFARMIMLPILKDKAPKELRGLCNARGLHASVAAEQNNFDFATTDSDEIMKDDKTSSVFLLTRHDLHAEMVVQGLKAGKNVFVEKPLAITPKELETISETVESLGSSCPMLMVGFNRRFSPATAELRKIFSSVAPLHVSFRFSTAEIPKESWIHDPDVGGTRLVGEACHAIDVCLSIVKSPPKRIFAEALGDIGGERPTTDRVVILIRHENGSVSNISYQSGGSRSGPKERIEIIGGGKTAVVEDWGNVEVWGGKADKIRVAKSKGHREEIEAFLKASRRGGEWPIPWNDLYNTTWTTFAALQSLQTGLPVER